MQLFPLFVCLDPETACPASRAVLFPLPRMQLDAIHEELVVLTSSLLDGELAWETDDARIAWEVSLDSPRDPELTKGL